MSNRFDYVKYDEIAQALQSELKEAFIAFETSFKVTTAALEHIEKLTAALPAGRGSLRVVKKLTQLAGMRAQEDEIFATAEEAYMWCGKAIRDDQVATRGATLEEQRNDG